MAWKFDDNLPIYIQITERIKIGIICGEYKTGEKMPSVRDFAKMANVNPNTVQRTFASLEADGLIITDSTSGRYVTNNFEIIAAAKKQLALVAVSAYAKKMRELSFSAEEASTLAREYLVGDSAEKVKK